LDQSDIERTIRQTRPEPQRSEDGKHGQRQITNAQQQPTLGNLQAQME
jgi:hypothetical protein